MEATQNDEDNGRSPPITDYGHRLALSNSNVKDSHAPVNPEPGRASMLFGRPWEKSKEKTSDSAFVKKSVQNPDNNAKKNSPVPRWYQKNDVQEKERGDSITSPSWKPSAEATEFVPKTKAAGFLPRAGAEEFVPRNVVELPPAIVPRAMPEQGYHQFVIQQPSSPAFVPSPIAPRVVSEFHSPAEPRITTRQPDEDVDQFLKECFSFTGSESNQTDKSKKKDVKQVDQAGDKKIKANSTP